MKYFFNFKTFNRNGKVDNKELFYLRLLKKRMKENYQIHRNGCTLRSHGYPDAENNLFDGNIVEFYDRKSFAKFKLDYSGLLNPTINDWKAHIYSIVSFEVDDDFVDEADRLNTRYTTVERIINEKNDMDRICEQYNSTLTVTRQTVEARLSKISSGIFDNLDSEFISKELRDKLENTKKSLIKLNEELAKPTMIENLNTNSMFYYSNPELIDLRQKHIKHYKKLYKNIQQHDIP